MPTTHERQADAAPGHHHIQAFGVDGSLRHGLAPPLAGAGMMWRRWRGRAIGHVARLAKRRRPMPEASDTVVEESRGINAEGTCQSRARRCRECVIAFNFMPFDADALPRRQQAPRNQWPVDDYADTHHYFASTRGDTFGRLLAEMAPCRHDAYQHIGFVIQCADQPLTKRDAVYRRILTRWG